MPLNFDTTTKSYTHNPKDDWKDRVRVVVGDDKDATTFHPQVKIERWDNEVNFSMRLKHDEKNPTVEFDGEKIKWKGKKVECHFYDKPEASENGGCEFEVVLKSKSKINILEFSIDKKDVKLIFLPGITQDDSVKNSYLVRMSSPKRNVVDGNAYRMGDVATIYRPKIIDAKGNWIWGEYNTDADETGILSITIDQKFLNEAVYPVIVDPTVGNSTAYSGSNVANGNILYGIKDVMRGSGSISSISVYIGKYNEDKFKGILVRASDKVIIGVTEIGTAPESFGWATANFASPIDVSDLNYYYIAIIPDVGSSSVYLGSSSVSDSGFISLVDASNSYATPTDPTDGSEGSTQYLIYATFTGDYEVVKGHSAYTDAAFCYVAGGTCISTNNSNLRMGYRDGPTYGNCDVAVRFQAIAIPQGATINAAYFYYEAQDTDASTDNVTIFGEDVDDAAAPSTTYANANSPHNKTPTTASVNWTLPNQTDDVSYKSPDIKSIIQEITDRVGWATGNDLCILIRNNGATENHNALNTAGKFVLVVDYTTGGGTTTRTPRQGFVNLSTISPL